MLDSHLLQQLRSIEQKYHKLTAKLQSPIDLSHEDISWTHHDINSFFNTVNKFRIWNRLQLELIEVEQIIEDSEIDREFYHIAILEARELVIKSNELEHDLKILLLPKDPNDEKSIILEILHFNYGLWGKPRLHNAYGCDLNHKPTGIRIFYHEERSQRQNKERAIQIMRAKLYDIKLREQQDEVSSMRKSQVGTGSRSEKIRTYNYKDNRATDHRLGHNFGLEKVLSGDLEEVIQSCISQDQQERLAELSASTGGVNL